jgi:hypothetical protein
MIKPGKSLVPERDEEVYYPEPVSSLSWPRIPNTGYGEANSFSYVKHDPKSLF